MRFIDAGLTDIKFVGKFLMFELISVYLPLKKETANM